MGLISGHSPEYFAWERWILNWLDDTQVVCLSSGSITATLNAVPVVGGDGARGLEPIPSMGYRGQRYGFLNRSSHVRFI